MDGQSPPPGADRAELVQVTVDVVDPTVTVVTLNHPERRNAMTAEMTRSWVDAVARLSVDQDVRCVVLTGAGTAFCAGGDLSWLAGDATHTVEQLRRRMSGFYADWLAVRDLRVPVVAALNGAAVGAGLALALACDIRVAAESAPLSVPFTALGLHPGMAVTWSLVEAVGTATARDLLLTGRVVNGREAVPMGLVSRAVSTDRVLAEALAVARQVAAHAPVATALTKAALAGGGPPDPETALRWEALAQAVTLATADVAEGLAARSQRRAPRFTGR